jgi:hypothetical protein
MESEEAPRNSFGLAGKQSESMEQTDRRDSQDTVNTYVNMRPTLDLEEIEPQNRPTGYLETIEEVPSPRFKDSWGRKPDGFGEGWFESAERRENSPEKSPNSDSADQLINIKSGLIHPKTRFSDAQTFEHANHNLRFSKGPQKQEAVEFQEEDSFTPLPSVLLSNIKGINHGNSETEIKEADFLQKNEPEVEEEREARITFAPSPDEKKKNPHGLALELRHEIQELEAEEIKTSNSSEVAFGKTSDASIGKSDVFGTQNYSVTLGNSGNAEGFDDPRYKNLLDGLRNISQSKSKLAPKSTEGFPDSPKAKLAFGRISEIEEGFTVSELARMSEFPIPASSLEVEPVRLTENELRHPQSIHWDDSAVNTTPSFLNNSSSNPPFKRWDEPEIHQK